MKKNLKIFDLKVLVVLCSGLFYFPVLSAFIQNDSVKNNNIYLFRAAKNGDMDWVKKLVEKKNADVNYKTNSGKTVLIKAVTKKRKKVVHYLLVLKDKDKKRIVNFNCADNNGQTALHKAAKNGGTVITKMLITVGADKNMQDRYGNTALHIAAKNGFFDVIKELVLAGENLEIKNNKGDTPLHIAARENYKTIVEFLIKNGANINTKNKNGRMPIDDTKIEIKKLLDKKD